MVDQTTETDTVHRNQKIVLVIFAAGVLCIGGYPPWDVECNFPGEVQSLPSRIEYAPLFAPPYIVNIPTGAGTVGLICASSGINTSSITGAYFAWILLMGVAFVLVHVKKPEEQLDPD